MRRKLYAALCVFTAASMVTACGKSFEAAESTVYITKQGTITGADIEDFNEDYYDEEELKAYITESVESYVKSNGDGSVELDRFKTEKSDDGGVMAKLYLNYATYIDYALFNDITFFAGTVLQAQAENYTFDQEFQKAEDGSLTGSALAEEFLEDKDMKIVIAGDETIVKVDGTIKYVSDGNVELSGKDTARVHYDVENPDAQPAYIIYK